MHVRRLALENFRNIALLDLELPRGRVVLFGENAQGKTNVLEAVSMFAAARSVRAGHERELIKRDTLGDPIPFARAAAAIERTPAARAPNAVQVEIVVQLSGQPPAGRPEEPRLVGAPDDGRQLVKRVKVNGVPRRAGDLIGEVQAVLFEPQDIELVYGPPSLRRRHLDLTLAQVDRALLRELQRYSRVLAQRNPLLKAVREGQASIEELAFWDAELAEAGAFITHARRQALAEIEILARAIYRELAGGAEELGIVYRPSLDAAEGSGAGELAAAFRDALTQTRQREIMAGATLLGPHRDDLTFEVQGTDLALFGSRGQQRLAALALKLAEAQFMTARAGDRPLLLLDDVLSELDPLRRGYLLERIGGYEQSLLTTADVESLDRVFRSPACLLRVAGGRVESPVGARQGGTEG